MTTYSNDNTEARAPKPLDAKMFVGVGESFLYDTKTDIPRNYRYIGMIVYEIPDSITVDTIYPIWQLKGGIEDANWVQINIGTGSGSTGTTYVSSHKEVAPGGVNVFIFPGGYNSSNCIIFINGILITNDQTKPETAYTIIDYVTYSTLTLVRTPEDEDEIVAVKTITN